MPDCIQRGVRQNGRLPASPGGAWQRQPDGSGTPQPMSELLRRSGVQLHITSLPGGTLGREAYRFVDWLAAAGQSWWQVLPLGPPDRHHSPYKARSAFAAWPGLVGERRASVSTADVAQFRERNAWWVEDWERFVGRNAVADQVRFQREWDGLRDYARDRGVRLLGDLAIYVAPGSVDHRAHPELFQEGSVAGAPPDSFSASGQLWGNPLYDWPAVQRRHYRWWVQRVARSLDLFDLVRVDHFRGFVAYWAIPSGARSARAGRWRRGPGRAVFDAVGEQLDLAGRLPLVAEDLGVITPPVQRLRDRLGLPGMLVLQFGWSADDPGNPHRLANHLEHRIIYTGTHDHDTARGWWQSLDPDRRRLVEATAAERSIRLGRAPWWGLIRLALSSPARLAMMQAQDILGLGSEARMNDPARAGGSWRWRMRPGALTRSLAARLRDATEEAGRLPD
jgi:4-alpha-glucanotransferase